MMFAITTDEETIFAFKNDMTIFLGVMWNKNTGLPVDTCIKYLDDSLDVRGIPA